MNGASSNTVGQSAGTSIGAASRANANNIALAANATPEWDKTNIGGLDDLIGQYAALNGYKSKALEEKMDPRLAGLRDDQEQDLVDTYDKARHGDLPVGVQNALMRSGLASAISTGTGVGKNSVGAGTATRVFGSGSNDYLNQVRSMVNGYIAQNPMKAAGIDPSTAASVKLGMDRNNMNLANTYKQQILQTALTGNDNLTNLTNGWLQSAAQENASNAASKQAAGGQTMGMIGTLAGAAAMAM